MNIYELHVNNYAIRYETLEGRRHLVVPAVIMREGVHCGSHGPLLHLADELGRFSGAWNGIPVTIRHPEKNGSAVSANLPDILDQYKVGTVFNTVLDNDKLKSEVWIDEDKIKRISPEALSYIVNRRPLDVSVGVFTDEDETPGIWNNNEEYTAIARNHRPDHLALLPGEQGACSWADGCGIRTHKKGGDASVEIQINALSYRGTESTEWSTPTLSDFGMEGSWSELSQADRAKVANHYLIGSASVESFGDLHFPVVNPSTGRLNERALRAVISGRGAALTAVPAETRDAARRRAYRLLNDEFDAGLEIPETLSLANQLRKSGYSVIQINADPGYNEIVRTLQGKLDAMDADSRIHFLQEVYEDYFVYEVRNNGASVLYKRGYTVDGNGDIEIMGEPEEVVREVSYQPKTNKGGIQNMCENGKPCAGASAKIDCIIKNNSKFEDTDKEWLSTLSEDQLDKIAGPVEEPPKPQMNKEEAIQVLKGHLSDPDKFMGLLPDDVKAQMQYGMKAYKDKRAELIGHITTNSEVYTEDELNGKDMVELEKLASLVKTPIDYSLNGGGSSNYASSEDELLLPAGIEVGGDK